MHLTKSKASGLLSAGLFLSIAGSALGGFASTGTLEYASSAAGRIAVSFLFALIGLILLVCCGEQKLGISRLLYLLPSSLSLLFITAALFCLLYTKSDMSDSLESSLKAVVYMGNLLWLCIPTAFALVAVTPVALISSIIRIKKPDAPSEDGQ